MTEYYTNEETGEIWAVERGDSPRAWKPPVMRDEDTGRVFIQAPVPPYRDRLEWREMPTPSEGWFWDVLKNIGTGAGKAVADLGAAAETGRATREWMRSKGLPVYQQETVPGSPDAVLEAFLPTRAGMERTIFQGTTPGDVGLPYYTPSTGPGRLVQTGVHGGVSGAALGGPYGAIPGVIGGVAQQGVAEMGGSPGMQVAAGIGVPLALGGLGMAARAAFPGAQQALADAMRTVTPQQLADAQRLVTGGATWAEALARTTGNDRFLAVQRVIEQSSGGQSVLSQYMNDRVGRNAAMAQQQLDQIAPMPAGQALTDVPANMQTAAQRSMGAARAERFAAADPYYQAAKGEALPLADAQAVIAQIDNAIRGGPRQAKPNARVVAQLQQLRADLIEAGSQAAVPGRLELRGLTSLDNVGARPAIPEVPKTNIGALDSVRKLWRERIETSGTLPGQLSDNAVANEAAAIIGPILTDMRNRMTRASPSYRAGRETHARLSESTVNPLDRGPVGQLTRTPPELAAQRQKVMPAGEQGTMDPAVARATSQQIQQHGAPGTMQNFVRSVLDSAYDQATRRRKSKAEQWGGGGFALNIAGSGRQAATLEATIRSLPNGNNVWPGFRRMLDVFEAQGARHAPGSMTEHNRQLVQDLKDIGINVPTIGGLKRAYENWRYRGNSEELARMLIDPNNAEMWRRLSNPTRGAGFALGLAPQVMPMGQAPAFGTTNLFGAPQ